MAWAPAAPLASPLQPAQPMMNHLLAALRRRVRRVAPLLALAALTLAFTGCLSDEDPWEGLSVDEQYAYAGDCSSCKGGKDQKGSCDGKACPQGQWCDTGYCKCCCDNTKPTGGQGTYHTYKYGSCDKDCSTLNDTECPNKAGGLCWVTTSGNGCEKLSDPAGTLGLSPSEPYRICNCKVTCNASLPDANTKYEGCGKPGNGKCPALVCPGTTKVKECTKAAEKCSTPTPTPTASSTPPPPSPTATASATPTPWPTASPWPTPSPTATASATPAPAPTAAAPASWSEPEEGGQ